jgi:LAO/AO transport system kinase
MTSDLAGRIKSGERRALAKAITLLESNRSADDASAADLLAKFGTNPVPHTLRVGICGSPGVGKSSFIDVLGCELIARGHRVAVLAVDPTSPLSGGSILGDKTRMENLSQSEQAFIRPSPGGGVPGGITANTHEVIQVLEYAGFDMVLLETVGIGQSETDVANLVDLVVYLHQPESGDDLQAIKKGIIEVSDVFVVTKADGHLKTAAEAAARQIKGVVGEAGKPVLCVSSTEHQGFGAVADGLLARRKDSAAVAARRQSQLSALLNNQIVNIFRQWLTRNESLQEGLCKAAASGQSLRSISKTFLAKRLPDFSV